MNIYIAGRQFGKTTKYGSFNYRSGMIATLDRAIKKLEAEKDA